METTLRKCTDNGKEKETVDDAPKGRRGDGRMRPEMILSGGRECS